jgi:hypothetical protein
MPEKFVLLIIRCASKLDLSESVARAMPPSGRSRWDERRAFSSVS